MKVKPLAEIVRKWVDVTPGRQAYYQSGAVGAGADWEKNTIAASGAFRQAVSAGTIEAMYKGGVKRAGAAKFDRKVETVGVPRFAQGVQAAEADFNAGFSPYVDELARITLPARAPRGSEANLQRVRQIMTDLHKKRLALRAAGA